MEIFAQHTDRGMNRWYLGFHPRFSSSIHRKCVRPIVISSAHIVTYFHGANVEISMTVWCFWAKSVRLLYVTSSQCKITGDFGQNDRLLDYNCSMRTFWGLFHDFSEVNSVRDADISQEIHHHFVESFTKCMFSDSLNKWHEMDLWLCEDVLLTVLWHSLEFFCKRLKIFLSQWLSRMILQKVSNLSQTSQSHLGNR